MKPPIYVYEPCDLGVYETVQRAQQDVEAIDVRNNVYYFYDSEGKILDARIIKDSGGIEHVVLTDGENNESDEGGLRRILLDFLVGFDYPESDLERMNLSELVRMSLMYPTK